MKALILIIGFLTSSSTFANWDLPDTSAAFANSIKVIKWVF